MDWHNCYKLVWTVLVPAAFAHPAKVSFGLAERIYQHAIDESWLEPGQTVVDPFGGIGGFAFHAMRHGLRWVGVELEQKFVDLGNQNISKWMREYAPHFPGWGSAQLLHGDSRNLLAVIGEAAGVVSSPPYADTSNMGGDQATKPSMKWAEIEPKIKRGVINRNNYRGENYGSTLGNLGNLRTTASGLAAAISSPPYAETPISNYDGNMGQQWQETGKTPRQRSGGKLPSEQYGSTPGQLGAMRASGLDAAVSSPPWEKSLDRGRVDPAERRRLARSKGISNAEFVSPIDMEAIGERKQEYGQTPGQLAEADDFWLAARAIVDQVYAALRPGGCAIWVVKAFVKNGERVDFPGQWRQMCEAAGFETLHQHRAWLVEQRGAQFDLNGDLVEKRVERKSFFRRLAEKKGSPRIDYEVVLCQRRPLPLPAAAGGG